MPPDSCGPGITRRQFVGAAAVLVAGSGLAEGQEPVPQTNAALPEPSPDHLPRWRGFNLLEKFDAQHASPFREADFALVAEWGFNFVRLPMSYRCWTDPSNWLNIRDDALNEVDEAIRLGQKHSVHVNLNLHRAPGYCVNPPPEPAELWTDEGALGACALHWAHLARRYKGVPSRLVSFDLLNEPADVPEEKYVRVITRLVEAIRAEDPDRLIIADGLKWGSQPVPGLAGLHIAQSTRGYTPSRVSHYQASWVQGSAQWPEPAWPLVYTASDDQGHTHEERWDKQRLKREQIDPWQRLQAMGVGVHVGEWGAFNRTPHDACLAWMRDCLDLWKQAGWGWALWNLRGGFGVLDSDRHDVHYESFRGHQLDRAMLELLQAS